MTKRQSDLSKAKELIKRHGPTELSRRTGVPIRTLYSVARDEFNVKYETLMKILGEK